jgi:hypothetical protein
MTDKEIMDSFQRLSVAAQAELLNGPEEIRGRQKTRPTVKPPGIGWWDSLIRSSLLALRVSFFGL